MSEPYYSDDLGLFDVTDDSPPPRKVTESADQLRHKPTTATTPSGSAWDTREDETWIDKL